DHQVSSLQRDADALLPWGNLLSKFRAMTRSSGDAPNQWDLLTDLLHSVPTLADLPQLCDSALVQLSALETELAEGDGTASQFTKALEQTAGTAGDVLSRLAQLAHN